MHDPTAHDVLIELLGAAALLLWGMRMVRTGIQRAFGSCGTCSGRP
jgi:phosphate:Na+ symporter